MALSDGNAIRAFIYDGTSVHLNARHPAPSAAPGEAVIRPTRVGISTTDRQIAAGLLGFTGVLGHEFVGIVQSVNGEDAGKMVGTRVVAAIVTACGRCPMCQGGLASHCRTRTMLGLQERDGCFADLFTLPVANLVPVPDSVDDDHAVFAQPLAAAIQAARQLTIEGKPYITVLGDGPLGLLTVQIMARLNASVRLIGKHTAKLGLCEKWGIKHRHVDDIGRRADQDIVVDCTGSASGFGLATELVRPRGKIVLKTLLPPDTAGNADVLAPIVFNEIDIIGSYCGPVREAVALLKSREIDVLSLISKRSTLAQAESAWKAAAQPGVIKLLMDV